MEGYDVEEGRGPTDPIPTTVGEQRTIPGCPSSPPLRLIYRLRVGLFLEVQTRRVTDRPRDLYSGYKRKTGQRIVGS